MCDAPEAAAGLAEKLSSRCKEVVAAESILAIAVNVSAFLGNALVCLAIYRNVRLRRISNMYVLSYAVIDLLMSILVMPLSLRVIMEGQWISTPSACQFQGYVTQVLGSLTMLTMALTAIDRYFATVRPVQYTYFFKRRYVCVAIAVCWFLAFAVPLSYSIVGRDFAFHPGSVVCSMDMTNGGYVHASVLQLLLVVLPLLIIGVCYWRVLVKIISNQEKNMTLFQEEESVTKLFAALVMGILVCWSPHFLLNIVDTFRGQYSLVRSVYFLCSFLVGVACCIKPIIVYIFDVDFKAEFKRILCFRRSRKIIDLKDSDNPKPKVEDPKSAPESRRYFLEGDERNT